MYLSGRDCVESLAVCYGDFWRINGKLQSVDGIIHAAPNTDDVLCSNLDT